MKKSSKKIKLSESKQVMIICISSCKMIPNEIDSNPWKYVRGVGVEGVAQLLLLLD